MYGQYVKLHTGRRGRMQTWIWQALRYDEESISGTGDVWRFGGKLRDDILLRVQRRDRDEEDAEA